MAQNTTPSSLQITTFHQNNSLLFQFILSEFTDCFSALQRINLLYGKMSDSKILQDERESLTLKYKEETEKVLKTLMGACRDHKNLYSWNFSEGGLSRLKTYCTLFLQNSDTDEKELIALQHYSEKIWSTSLNALEVSHTELVDPSTLHAAVEKLSTSMNRFSKIISRMILQFRDDENVIFYIVRHHKLFDKLYGHRFVTRLLGRMYPKGNKEAQHILIKKYISRGFENIISIIEANFLEIEAASL